MDILGKVITAPAPRRGFGELFGELKNKLDHLQRDMANVIPAMPGQNVGKYFDLAIGIDFHTTVFPPSPLLPVPHIGMVFDIMGAIMDAISTVVPPPPTDGSGTKIGTICKALVHSMKPSVQVHGQWVANAGTGIQHLPGIFAHLPFPIVKPMASSEMFMGSSTVLADGGPCSTQFHPALSCNLVGLPAPLRLGKPKAKIALMAPTSMLLIITSGGNPVLVGGPPTIDLFQLAMKLGLKGMGKLWKKMGNSFQTLIDKLRKGGKSKLAGILKPVKCFLFGEPVDAATGRVYSSNTDVELPGPLPFVWERTYYSDAEIKGPLGYNWHHSYHMGLFKLDDGYALLRLADGREMSVPLLGFGESWYSREEQMTFSKDEEGYLLIDADKLHYRFNGPKNREGYAMLSQIVSKEGFCISLEYNALGDLRQITDCRNQLIHVETDAHGRITRLHTEGTAGKSVTLVAYSYDELSNMTSVKDIAGAQKHFYYAGHLLVKLTNQTGQSFYWEYEGLGDEAKCIHTWGDGGILEYWTVYNDGHTTTRNSLGHTAHYFYDENHLIYKIIDENGGVTHQRYNAYQELELVVDPEGLTKKFEYNNHGKLTKVENGGITTYEYDDRLNLTRITSPGRKSIAWKYDTLDRVIEKKNTAGRTLLYSYEGPHLRTVSDEQGNTYELYFDHQHQLVQLTHPTKLLSFWQYDKMGNVLLTQDVQGLITKYAYDEANNLIYIREPTGNAHYLKYDSSRNIIHAKDDDRDVKFRYGSLGILLERTENGRSVGFSYDTALQLKSIRNEGGERYRFGLDAMGNVVSEWGFDGLQRRYERDAKGRVSKVLRSADQWSRYAYDGQDNVVMEEHSDKTWAAYKYDTDGLLIAALNEDVHLQFQRDRAGRVIKETQGAYSISRSYDKWGNATQISSSLGADIQLDHDSQGLITQMQSGDWQAKWAYNKRGMEIQRELSGGVRVETIRDSYGRVYSRSIGVNHVEQSHHRYTWKQGNRLHSIINNLGQTTSFEYDAWDNLISGQYSNGKEVETIYKAPDAIGNLFKTPERNDRVYDAGGSLLKDEKYHYHYDAEGNLVFKEFIQTGYPRLFASRDLEKELHIKLKASGKGTVYEWGGNGMLKSVLHPEGYKVYFYYDALGRRIAKTRNSIVTRWLWDGNVPLHEWQYEGVYPPELSVDESKQLQQEPEPVENLVTWLFEENSFVPCGKIVGKETYSIVSDYLGTPSFMYNAQGEKVWECTLDIYGKVRTLQGSLKDCPFRYQGQYDDVEIGLYYNRFRYYDPNTGNYISQDPIGLNGGIQLYGYVHDPNSWVDPFGLTGTYKFTDGKTSYIGKGPENRMYASMKERVGGKSNVTQGTHVDFGDNKTGLMVEAEMMRRNDAVKSTDFDNAINSPGEKMLKDAELNDKSLYDDIMKKADDFETKFNNQKGKGIKCH